jgi:hypothetical protein
MLVMVMISPDALYIYHNQWSLWFYIHIEIWDCFHMDNPAIIHLYTVCIRCSVIHKDFLSTRWYWLACSE